MAAQRATANIGYRDNGHNHLPQGNTGWVENKLNTSLANYINRVPWGLREFTGWATLGDILMRKIVEVTQTIEVEIDEKKFTPEFMQDFRKHFYDFNSVDDHIKHIAQMEARGLIQSEDAFVEGYGNLDAMGIFVSTNGQDQEEEIVS